jgi:hypothetical protein
MMKLESNLAFARHMSRAFSVINLTPAFAHQGLAFVPRAAAAGHSEDDTR